MMMKTIAVCVALVAGPALAADAPSFVVVGAAGESRTLGGADLQKLIVREVSVTDPHSKQPSRYRGVALSRCFPLWECPRGSLAGPRFDGSSQARMARVRSLAEPDAGTGEYRCRCCL
jgi:hypothetical protein